MVKVGDKVVVVSCPDWENCSVGDVLEVVNAPTYVSFWAISTDGNVHYVGADGVDGNSAVVVRPYTESEAEKRGAKFGTMGVVKDTGDRCVYIGDSLVIPGYWEIDVKGKADRWHRHPSEIRLDHEPEFVAWVNAPEELKYDASRVYCGGEPVEWIAKPKGANLSDVVYVTHTGIIRCASEALKVKL